MKQILFLILIMAVCIMSALAQDSTTADETAQVALSLTDWLIGNWAELLIGLMAFVKIVVRLTPTLKDDAVFGKIDTLIAWFIPNYERKT